MTYNPKLTGERMNKVNEASPAEGDVERVVMLQRDALVMANARRLIKAKKITSNGRLYSELFGTGHGTARAACRELGICPDSNETRYNTMMAYLAT